MVRLTLAVAAAGVLATSFAFSTEARAGEKRLKVINNREAFPIWFIYITPAGQRGWGEDQLGGQVLSAGRSRTWDIAWDSCYVDVMAKTFTGLTVEKRNLDVCGGTSWTISDDNSKQERKSVQVVNRRQAFPIWKIYLTPAGQSDWGRDQLGENVIDAGQSRTWTIPWDGCYVDIKAVSFTGLSTERRNVNACEGTVWTIYD